MQFRFVRTALTAALMSGLASMAAAQGMSQASTLADAMRYMSPQQAKAWATMQLKRQQQARTTAGTDVTPPTLTAFNAPGSVDVTIADNPLLIPVKGTDDLSGISYGYANAIGPSGQMVYAYGHDALPSKKFSTTMNAYSLSAFAEPGTYQFQLAYFYDKAGNIVFVDQAGLTALGKTTFVVKNKRGYDAVAPTLQSGQVTTASLSLSATHPGTTEAPYAGATINAIDSGNTAIAGIQAAVVDFCLADQSHCFAVWGDDIRGPRSVGAVSLRLAGQLDRASLVPGEYRMRFLSVTDYAGNYQNLWGSDFGGGTDFSTYFPVTTITLTP